MQELLERQSDMELTMELTPVVSAIKQTIDARLAAIHTEPQGRHELIVSALMLGCAATRSQLQV